MSYRGKQPVHAGSESPPPQPASRRRPGLKHTQRVDSDVEEEEEERQPSPRSSPEIPHFHRTHSSKSIEEDYNIQVDDDEYEEDDARQGGKSKSRRRSFDAPPPRKKARVQSGPESEEEEYMDEDMHVSDVDNNGDDDDFIMEDEPSKKGKNKGGKQANKKIGKDAAPPRKKPPPVEKPAGVKRPRPSLKNEDSIVDIVGDASGIPDTTIQTSPTQVKDDSPVPPIQKRRKLPTIKKNKPATSAGPGTPLGATPKTAGPIQKPVVPEATGAAKSGRAAALAGSTDLDLADKSVYEELFKSGASQRNASTRRTKEEERRKELDKLRDEARVKREEEAKHSFDLQAQYEKITKFEERLRREKNAVLFPNQMAVKLRVQWDREYAAKKERREENGDSNGREEGEMNESPSVSRR